MPAAFPSDPVWVRWPCRRRRVHRRWGDFRRRRHVHRRWGDFRRFCPPAFSRAGGLSRAPSKQTAFRAQGRVRQSWGPSSSGAGGGQVPLFPAHLSLVTWGVLSTLLSPLKAWGLVLRPRTQRHGRQLSGPLLVTLGRFLGAPAQAEPWLPSTSWCRRSRCHRPYCH